MKNIEEKWIKWCRQIGYKLTNVKKGRQGTHGFRFSIEQKENLSKTRRKYYEENPQTKEKIANTIRKNNAKNPESSISIIYKKIFNERLKDPNSITGGVTHIKSTNKWLVKFGNNHIKYCLTEKEANELRKQVELFISNGGILKEFKEKIGVKKQIKQKITGVRWNKEKNKWEARYGNNYLKRFDIIDNAISLRKQAEEFIKNGGTIIDFKKLYCK